MDAIYFKIKNLLTAVDGIKYVDFDFGQLEEDKPPVNFPCALVNIAYTKCEDLFDQTQRVRCVITVKLGFNISVEKTASIYNDAAIQQNLSYFNIVNAVYKSLQGYTDGNIEELSRSSLTQPIYPPGLKVTIMPFETEFDENA